MILQSMLVIQILMWLRGLNDWFCELLEIQDTTYLIETAEGRGLAVWGQ